MKFLHRHISKYNTHTHRILFKNILSGPLLATLAGNIKESGFIYFSKCFSGSRELNIGLRL